MSDLPRLGDISDETHWHNEKPEQLSLHEAAAKLREAIRQERDIVERMRVARGDFQRGIDEIWELWRRFLPADYPPPKRPRVGEDHQKTLDALDQLLRKLNRLSPPMPSPPGGGREKAGEIGASTLEVVRGVGAVASICQAVPAAITTLRTALAEPTGDADEAAKTVYNLTVLFTPISRNPKLLHLALAIYRTVSRRPRRLCGIAAPSATEWLLRLVQSILGIAEKHAWRGGEELTAEEHEAAMQRQRTAGWHFKALLKSWPAIRDEFAVLKLPDDSQLVNYRVEAEWELAQALRRCKAAQGSNPAEAKPSGGIDEQTRQARMASFGPPPPALWTDEPSRQQTIAKLTSAVRKAWLSFEAARMKAEKKDMEDWEAYKLLKEEGIPDDSQCELTEYQLPAEETWKRYLRKARRALGEQKYTFRRGRPHGGSIARQDQIEQLSNDDE